MKQHNPLIWGIASIVMGILIMVYPDQTLTLILRIIGIALLCIGVIQMIIFLISSEKGVVLWNRTPLGAVLALLLGVMLAITPGVFATFFMIILGTMIFVLALLQIFSFIRLTKTGVAVKWWLYITPCLMFLSGFVFFIFPQNSAAWIVIFAGAWVLAYGIWEIVGYFATYQLLKKGSSEK